MRVTTKRIIFVFISLAFFMASVLVYSLLIRASYEDISNLRGQLASKSDTLTKYQTTLNQAQKLLQELQNAEEIRKQVSFMFPKDKDVSLITGQVIAIAKVNGLNLDTITTQLAPTQASESSAIKNIGRVKTQATLYGSYAGFKSFIKQLETNALLSDVTDFKIEGSQKAAVSRLDYAISIMNYYQSE